MRTISLQILPNLISKKTHLNKVSFFKHQK